MVAMHTELAELHALVGRVIDDRYTLDGIVAFGGMGTVFRGHHQTLGRPVAVKVLKPQLSADEQARARFEREAYSVSLLEHPNCIRVSDFGSTPDGLTYLVMELLEGTELTSFMVEPMSPALAVDRIQQVLAGLAHAHEHGIVHRDLKPDNVFVVREPDGSEVLKLLDFGIAKLVQDGGVQQRLTQSGVVFGTPHYMSPEQATGDALDGRSDLYAAGLILYRMLAGRPAFRGDSAADLIRMHVSEPPDALPDAVPFALAQITLRLLAKSPDDRFANARAVSQALHRIRPSLEGVPAAPVGGSASASTSVAKTQVAAPAPRARPALRASTASQSGRPSVMVPWIVAVASMLVAAGAIGLWLHERRSPSSSDGVAQAATVAEEDETPTLAAVDPTADEPDTDTASSDDATDKSATGVELTFVTPGLQAEVLDARDGGRLGTTNPKAEPADELHRIALPRSEASLPILLRAEGHHDRRVEVVPGHDKTYVETLDPLQKPTRKKTKRRKSDRDIAKGLADPFHKQ